MSVSACKKVLLCLCMIGFAPSVSGMHYLRKFNPMNLFSSATDPIGMEESIDLKGILTEDAQEQSVIEDVKEQQETHITQLVNIDVAPVIEIQDALQAPKSQPLLQPHNILKKIIETLSDYELENNDLLMVAPEKLAAVVVGNIVCGQAVNGNILKEAQKFFGETPYSFIVGDDQKELHELFATECNETFVVMQADVNSLNKKLTGVKDLTVKPVRHQEDLQQWYTIFSENKERMSDYEGEQMFQQCSKLHLIDKASLYLGTHKNQGRLAALIVMDADTAYIAYRGEIHDSKKNNMALAVLQRCFKMAHEFKKDLKSVVAISHSSQEDVFASLGLIKNQQWTKYMKQ